MRDKPKQIQHRMFNQAQRDFITAFVTTGNPRKAWLASHPTCTAITLRSAPYNYLAKPHVKKEVARLQEMVADAEVLFAKGLTKGKLVTRLIDIADRAKEDDEKKVEVTALKEAGTVAGHYDKEEEPATNFTTFIQNIVCDVVQLPENAKKKQDVIDAKSEVVDIGGFLESHPESEQEPEKDQEQDDDSPPSAA